MVQKRHIGNVIFCAFVVAIFILLYSGKMKHRGILDRGQERKIFFAETTCAGTDFPLDTPYAYEPRLRLSPHAACAVEAAARAHPHRLVTLVHTCPFRLEDAANGSVPAHAVELLSLPNVRLWSESLRVILKGSPLQKLMDKGVLARSLQQEQLGREMLRSFLLWHHGGTFLDTDVIVLRDMGELRNFACSKAEDDDGLAVLDFAGDTVGVAMADDYMQELGDFQSDATTFDGPGAIMRIMRERCPSVIWGAAEQRCEGFSMVESCAFSPVGRDEWRRFFATVAPVSAEVAAETLQRSLGVGINASLFSQEPLAQIVRRACPGVVAAAVGLLP